VLVAALALVGVGIEREQLQQPEPMHRQAR